MSIYLLHCIAFFLFSCCGGLLWFALFDVVGWFGKERWRRVLPCIHERMEGEAGGIKVDDVDQAGCFYKLDDWLASSCYCLLRSYLFYFEEGKALIIVCSTYLRCVDDKVGEMLLIFRLFFVLFSSARLV